MSDTVNCPAPLATFMEPILGLTAWGVKQGHGSFLTFEFGQPKLEIKEHLSRSRRSAYVHGQWHLWIYCCHWRITQDGTQLACSEDDEKTIGRAIAALNGQNLISVSVQSDQRSSEFMFDLGGLLETWPYGEDPTDEQWMIYSENEVFSLNASGDYALGPGNTPSDVKRWSPLR